MAEYSLSAAKRTDVGGSLSDYSVAAQALDTAADQKETYYDFPNAGKHLGYYKTIPELKRAIEALAIWTVGKGIQTDTRTMAILENVIGWGEDTIQSIFENLIIQKKVYGDAFAEVITSDKGDVINLKPLNPADMRIVTDSKGLIIRYEQRTRGKGNNKKFKPYEILHLCNDRVANEIHGTSVIDVLQWVIDARHEALTDHRIVIHRNRTPVRIIEIDSDNTTKRDALIAEYEDAIKKGEVLVLPKGTVDIKDTQLNIQDPIQWIQYLENFFYQVVGVPRVIATSQDYTEAASKVGYLTFEPTYTREQTLLEADIYSQLGLRIKFNRPPSLHGVVSQDEQKNTGQVGIQQNEVQASARRVE